MASELDQRLAAAAVSAVADWRSRLARIAEALEDGEIDLAAHMVEDLDRDLSRLAMAAVR